MIDQTSAEKIEVEKWRLRALELRRDGLDYRSIAKKLAEEGGPTSTSRAHELVVEALGNLREEQRETAKDIKDLELTRLDVLLDSLLKKLNGPKVSARTAARLVDSILRIMDRRARYLGLDAPKRIEATGGGGTPLLPPGAVMIQLVRPGDPIPVPPAAPVELPPPPDTTAADDDRARESQG